MSEIPTMGRIVIYRHPRGYDVPAIVTATLESIDHARRQEIPGEKPITAADIRSVDDSEHLHLTLFTSNTTASYGAEVVRNVPRSRWEATPPPRKSVLTPGWRWPDQAREESTATRP